MQQYAYRLSYATDKSAEGITQEYTDHVLGLTRAHEVENSHSFSANPNPNRSTAEIKTRLYILNDVFLISRSINVKHQPVK